MPLLGQASGGWTESSSALRLLHPAVRNSTGVLTDDAFTQANPRVITAAATVSTQVDTTATGVLSGSVAFARQDAGENFIGGPTADANNAGANDARQRPLGVFINSANGNAFENTPGTASGIGPYMSGMGTYGNSLFETQTLTGWGAGNNLAYTAGDLLLASVNGFLTNSQVATDLHDDAGGHASDDQAGAEYVIGILKMAPDAVQNELVYDQRI